MRRAAWLVKLLTLDISLSLDLGGMSSNPALGFTLGKEFT